MNSRNTFAASDKAGRYEIESVEKMKAELNNLDEDGKDSAKEREMVFEKAKPEVVEAFVQEKQEKAMEELNKLDLDEIMEDSGNGAFAGSKTIDIGDGCKVIVELEEGEDEGLVENIKDLIFEPAYAATNGEVMWKDYGNRYFTAKVTTLLGAGTCTLSLENHYSLSSKGITERYGVSDVLAISATTKITAGDPVITDATATTPGSSDVNMYCKYLYESTLSSGNFRINTTVGYVAKDATNKKIKVKHSWTWQ